MHSKITLIILNFIDLVQKRKLWLRQNSPFSGLIIPCLIKKSIITGQLVVLKSGDKILFTVSYNIIYWVEENLIVGKY